MRWKISLVFSFVVLFLCLVSAGFNVSEFNIQKNYGTSSDILGWVNISFQSQLINSSISDNLGNSIFLSDLLDLNPSYVSVFNPDNLTINSSFQKLYFDNASFSLPSSVLDLFGYKITLENQTILMENITISNAQEIVSEELEKKKTKLQNITNEINTFSLFLRAQIKSKLDISGIESNLTNLELIYNSSSENFDLILEELEKIEIPESVFETETANQISFVANENNIDLDVLQSIGGGSYNFSYEDQYKNAIIFWTQENLGPKITFKKISAQYEDQEINLLTYIEVIINHDISNEVYFIVEDINNLEFDKDYGESIEGDYIFIDFEQVNTKIIFTTSEDLDIDNLPFFISPPLGMILLNDFGEEIIDSDKELKVSKWILFSLILLLLIIIFVIIYFILKFWYDKKYENYLFKNRNNLYNLVVYINNAKKKGIKDGEIERNLKKAKWSNEQIRYVMRKYAGRRTGLWGPSYLKNIRRNQPHKI